MAGSAEGDPLAGLGNIRLAGEIRRYKPWNIGKRAPRHRLSNPCINVSHLKYPCTICCGSSFRKSPPRPPRGSVFSGLMFRGRLRVLRSLCFPVRISRGPVPLVFADRTVFGKSFKGRQRLPERSTAGCGGHRASSARPPLRHGWATTGQWRLRSRSWNNRFPNWSGECAKIAHIRTRKRFAYFLSAPQHLCPTRAVTLALPQVPGNERWMWNEVEPCGTAKTPFPENRKVFDCAGTGGARA